MSRQLFRHTMLKHYAQTLYSHYAHTLCLSHYAYYTKKVENLEK